jgi:hypothetical protein
MNIETNLEEEQTSETEPQETESESTESQETEEEEISFTRVWRRVPQRPSEGELPFGGTTWAATEQTQEVEDMHPDGYWVELVVAEDNPTEYVSDIDEGGAAGYGELGTWASFPSEQIYMWRVEDEDTYQEGPGYSIYHETFQAQESGRKEIDETGKSYNQKLQEAYAKLEESEDLPNAELEHTKVFEEEENS